MAYRRSFRFSAPTDCSIGRYRLSAFSGLEIAANFRRLKIPQVFEQPPCACFLFILNAAHAFECKRREASWRSGDAEDCKSLHPGSIPGEASIIFSPTNYGMTACAPIALDRCALARNNSRSSQYKKPDRSLKRSGFLSFQCRPWLIKDLRTDGAGRSWAGRCCLTRDRSGSGCSNNRRANRLSDSAAVLRVRRR